MIMRKIEDIYSAINDLVINIKSTYASGYENAEYKHELLRIYWHIEESLKNCPDFGEIEKSWHHQHMLEFMAKK